MQKTQRSGPKSDESPETEEARWPQLDQEARPVVEPARPEPRPRSNRSEKAIAITQIVANLAVALSLVFTGIQIRQAHHASNQDGRFQTWLDLFATFDNVNNYIAEHSTKLPLYSEFKSEKHTSILLFHHVNLAFRAWLYHDIGTLTSEEFQAFERWTDRIMFPWVEDQPCVAADLVSIMNQGDLYPERFLEWFKQLDGYARATRKASQCDAEKASQTSEGALTGSQKAPGTSARPPEEPSDTSENANNVSTQHEISSKGSKSPR